MNSNLPLVSVVITSYNRAQWIGKAIESALAQDYSNIEIVVSDNASTDNSDSVIQQYCYDSRLRYYRNSENIGMNANFKKATTELAKGDYITYISSDDYLVNPSFLSEGIRLILSNDNVLIAAGGSLVMNESDQKVLEHKTFSFYKNNLYKKSFHNGFDVFLQYTNSCHPVSFAACIMKRVSLLEIDCFNDKVLFGDVHIILHLLLQGNIVLINKPTYVVRLHENNASGGQNKNVYTYINNFLFIEHPYQFALNKKLLNKEILDKWRFKMLLNYSYGALIDFFVNNKSDYEILDDYVEKSYKDVHCTLIKNKKFMLKKVLSSILIGRKLIKLKADYNL